MGVVGGVSWGEVSCPVPHAALPPPPDTQDGNTALMWAIINNQVESVKILLAAGANKVGSQGQCGGVVGGVLPYYQRVRTRFTYSHSISTLTSVVFRHPHCLE